MKIGINLKAIARDGSFKTVTSPREYTKMIKKVVISDEFKKVLEEIEKNNHELFIFTPAPVELSDKLKLKIKRRLIKRFADLGMDISRITLIDDNDMVSAYRRNHMDIVVDSDKENVSGAREFTDAVEFDDSMTFDDMLKELVENINANREAVMAFDAEPNGLPSEDKLWMKYYREGDLKWKDERMSPYDRLISSNIDFKDEVAMEFFGRKYTYEEFFKEIDKIADNLLAHGVKKGMKVPFMFANTPEAIFTLYALYKIKATIVPLSPLVKTSAEEEILPKLKLIEDQNYNNGFYPTYFFITDILYNKMKPGIPGDVKTVTLPATESMPTWFKPIFKIVARFKMKIKPIKYDSSVFRYREFFRDDVAHQEIDTSFDNDYDAVQLYTGGTIRPKAVMLSEGNVDATARQFYNDIFDFRRGDKMAAFMPLNHSFGLIIGTHVAATLGVNLDLIMRIDFKKLYKYFLKDKVNIFGGIPTMFPSIRDDKKLQDADLSNVKYILSGGSKLDEAEREKTNNFMAEHNSTAEVRDGYGQTEVGGGIIYDGVPNIGTDVKIVTPGTIDEVGYEEIGELCITGPQVMRYYDEKSLTEAVLKKHADGRVWLHTGDCAVIHKNGKVEYVDRLDRMVKINGEQVVLSDLECVIKKLPFVADCAIVKIPDPIRECATTAYIQLQGDMEMTEDFMAQITALYKTKFPKYAIPKKTEVLKSFPKTAVGKNNFKELERMANEAFEAAKAK